MDCNDKKEYFLRNKFKDPPLKGSSNKAGQEYREARRFWKRALNKLQRRSIKDELREQE